MKWSKPLLTIILLPFYFLSCDSKPYPHVLQSTEPRRILLLKVIKS